MQPNQQYGGLSFVVDNSGRECYTRSSVEKACLDKNQQHFDQAGMTPCMVEPLFLLLGGLGDGPAVQSVLDGTFEQLDLPPTIQSFLASLQSEVVLGNETFSRFTWEIYQLVWSKAKEKTSSCRHYSLHFGHYMAVCQDDDLTDLHTQLGDIPLMHLSV